jgi:hypothetical protein
LLLAFGLALGSSPVWADSQAPLFDPSATYQVSGADLNRLNEDLRKAKSELETLKTRNEQLVKGSESKALALAELQTQLTTVSASFKTSQNEALANLIKVSAVVFVAGLAIDETAHHLGWIK